MVKSQNIVENVVADEVVLKVQESIHTGTPDHQAIQKMMDLITGVRGYVMHDLARQGIISKFFDKEIKRPKNDTGHPSNFSLGLEDIVSIFWENVYKDLHKAKSVGTDVQVRIVDGQTAESIVEKDGMKTSIRKTNCNAIYYLRWSGLTKTRSALTKAYTKNLMQICDSCGSTSSATKKEKAISCPECKCATTTKLYPSGSSKYRASKMRKCTSCKCEWRRQFVYACLACKSEEVRLESRGHTIDEAVFQLESGIPTIEETHIEHEMSKELDKVIIAVKAALPRNPQDSTIVTAGMEIFEMMVNPIASKEVCRLCVSKAAMVCEDKCKLALSGKDCSHNKVPDSNQSCGAATFSMATCVNYSKKIADYHECSASLTSRRVKTDRQYFVRYIVEHKNKIDVCASLYNIMKQKGLIDEYL